MVTQTAMSERKVVLKTFRFSESLSRSLEKEAADEGTSASALVNSIVSRHLNWDKKAREFGITEIPKSMLLGLLEECDDEALARLGREAGATWKEMAEFFLQDSSPDGLLNLLMARSKFSPNDRTTLTQEEGGYTIVMHHDFGPKWSIIAKNALQECVKQSFHVEPRVSIGDSVVTARFKVNPRNPSH